MSSAALRKKPTTIDELIGSSREGWFELVDGKPERVHIESFRVSRCDSSFVPLMGAGAVYDSEVYYRCFSNPKTSRKPDVSFISKGRLPHDADEVGYFTLVPDLIVEVMSPKDKALKVERKIREYRRAEVRFAKRSFTEVNRARLNTMANSTGATCCLDFGRAWQIC
jgi:Uma2 family endonuclease